MKFERRPCVHEKNDRYLCFMCRDMFPIFRSPPATAALENLLVEHVKSLNEIDAVVALESRGFLLAPFVSSKLKLPLVPVRKKGKLPGKTKQVEFTLEYGTVRHRPVPPSSTFKIFFSG